MFLLSRAPQKSMIHSVHKLLSLYTLFSFSTARASHHIPSLSVPLVTSSIRFVHQNPKQSHSSGDERYSIALLPNMNTRKFQNSIASLIHQPCSISASVSFPLRFSYVGL